MTADPRPFTEAIEGTGPAVLDYRGPQGWATVIHSDYRRCFVLLDGDGNRLVGDVEAWEGRTYERQTREYRVGLSGPQRLCVEYADQWSIHVTPLEQDEVEDGGFFSRHGIGNQTVEIVKPDPEGSAILEFTMVAYERRTASRYPLPTLYLSPPHGYWRSEENGWGSGDGVRHLMDHDRRSRYLPISQVQIEGAVNCEWRLRVLPLSAARPMEATTTGTGADVLIHTGPPAAVTLRHVQGRSSIDAFGYGIEPTGFDYESHRFSSLSARPDCPFAAGRLIGVLPEPTLVQVSGDGDWELRVIPLDELRTFDREITGTVGEVVRYTGPPAIARVITGSWRKWGGMASVQTLTPELSDVRWILARGGPLARFRPRQLELLPGMLVTIDAPFDGSGWRIRAEAEAGARNADAR